jgi:hypothetical protein
LLLNVLRLQFSLLCIAVAVCGCASNGDKVAVETELRHKEATIRSLENRVAESEKLLADQDHEIETLRTTVTAKPGRKTGSGFATVSSAVESQAAWGSVASVRIHKLTCGIVKDADGNSRSLNVVLQPLDDDNELVKVAAELKVTASIIAADGSTTPLVTKSFDLTESRRLWSRGLVSSGFHIQLPLAAIDAATLQSDEVTKLLVHATMELSPDRVYSTTELLAIE